MVVVVFAHFIYGMRHQLAKRSMAWIEMCAQDKQSLSKEKRQVPAQMMASDFGGVFFEVPGRSSGRLDPPRGWIQQGFVKHTRIVPGGSNNAPVNALKQGQATRGC